MPKATSYIAGLGKVTSHIIQIGLVKLIDGLVVQIVIVKTVSVFVMADFAVVVNAAILAQVIWSEFTHIHSKSKKKSWLFESWRNIIYCILPESTKSHGRMLGDQYLSLSKF